MICLNCRCAAGHAGDEDSSDNDSDDDDDDDDDDDGWVPVPEAEVAAVMQRYHDLQQEFMDQQLALGPIIIPDNQVRWCRRAGLSVSWCIIGALPLLQANPQRQELHVEAQTEQVCPASSIGSSGTGQTASDGAAVLVASKLSR